MSPLMWCLFTFIAALAFAGLVLVLVCIGYKDVERGGWDE